MNPLRELSQASAYDSPWSLRQRIAVAAWRLAWLTLCRWTPKPMWRWRLFVLRRFGARIDSPAFVASSVSVYQPWRLTMMRRACLGDRCQVYNLDDVILGEGATVSQEAYLCGGTHNFSSAQFELMVGRIEIGAEAFLGARAFVMPGVCVGERAIVGACSVVTKDVAPASIVAGNPAAFLKMRPVRTSEKA